MIGKFIKMIILNPMALIGIACGCYIMMNNGMDYINQILKDPKTYLPQAFGILWGICIAYAILFRPVYKTDEKKIDWKKTFNSSFEHLIVILCTAVFTCLIINAAHIDLSDKIDRYAKNIKTQDDLSAIIDE